MREIMCIHVYMYIRIYVYMHVCMYIYIYICRATCQRSDRLWVWVISLYLSLSLYICIYLYLSLYIYIYTIDMPYTEELDVLDTGNPVAKCSIYCKRI